MKDADAAGTWQRDATGRAVVAMVRMRPGSTSLDEESVAVALHGRGIVTLEISLLASTDEVVPADVTQNLVERLEGKLAGVPGSIGSARLPVGLCAGQKAAAVALAFAARRPHRVQAVVLLAGNLDPCGAELAQVHAPTLMVVGPGEFDALESNRRACRRLGGVAQLELLADEGRVFAASGVCTHKAELAAEWFDRHLVLPSRPPPLPAAGPAAKAGAHLADLLPARHGEADGTS